MQNVATPRFYIDLGQYLMAIGYDFGYKLDSDSIRLMSLNPSTQREVVNSPDYVHPKVPRVFPVKYMAYLGHNAVAYMYPVWQPEDLSSTTWVGDDNEGVNRQAHDYTQTPPEKGWSMWTFNDNPNAHYATAVYGSSSAGNKIGAISIGDYYDMPNSPDLSLTMSYEMDGIKEITTKGGASLSNMTYYKPADWGDGGAWQIGDDEDGNPLSNIRAGRRVWNLSFSYIADSDLMPKVAATSNIDAFTNDYNVDGYPSENTLLEGSDFFSMVWNRTLGGHLKFIFNPAGGGTSPNNNPDQFAICKFDMNSLQYKQVAHKVYDVKLKIREVW